MKTKDFIKLLQQEDPSGEAYLRLEGGAVDHVICKPGYYDGPYTYLDGDIMVTSTAGTKVDVYCQTWEDVVYNADGNMEQIRKNIRMEKDDPEFWKRVETLSKEVRAEAKRCLEEYTCKIFQRLKDGWRIFQDSGKPVGQCNAMICERNGQNDRLCQGECDAVLHSGFFLPVTDRETQRDEWIPDLLNGKVF